jgi:pimeloyl-ACP methyl ester carboxylesterase
LSVALFAVAAWRRRRNWALVAGGVLLAAMIARLVSAARGETLTLTNGDGARWLARLVDERDLAVWGARIVPLRDPERSRVPAALALAYDEMHAVEGDAPSPVVPTYLGLSDVIVVETRGQPKGALIFLHGFGGNFDLPCWQMARAAPELVTFCPSLGWRGDWWSERGKRTLERTIAMARKRGLGRIYLAGLSNGAAGAARLAPRMRGSFRGMILLSGAAHDSAAPGIPVLVLQGRDDQMMPASLARDYAERNGGQYVELDGGHFAFLLRNSRATQAISAWLQKQRD